MPEFFILKDNDLCSDWRRRCTLSIHFVFAINTWTNAEILQAQLFENSSENNTKSCFSGTVRFRYIVVRYCNNPVYKFFCNLFFLMKLTVLVYFMVSKFADD